MAEQSLRVRMASQQHTFIQIRLPAQNLVLGAATRRKGRAEALVESVVRKSQHPAFRVWSVVKGFQPGELERLTDTIAQRYDVTPRVSETDSGHHVVYDVFPNQIKDSFWGALLAFQTSFGPPWLQFAGGQVTLRAQGVDCEPPECAARLERALALAKTTAAVEIVQVPDHELADVRRLNELREARGGDAIDPRKGRGRSASPPQGKPGTGPKRTR